MKSLIGSTVRVWWTGYEEDPNWISVFFGTVRYVTDRTIGVLVTNSEDRRYVHNQLFAVDMFDGRFRITEAL